MSRQTAMQARPSFEGKYVDIVPDRALIFTWRHVTVSTDGSESKPPFSTVQVRFDDNEGGTLVTMRHEQIESEDGRRGVCGGRVRVIAAIELAEARRKLSCVR